MNEELKSYVRLHKILEEHVIHLVETQLTLIFTLLNISCGCVNKLKC